MELAGFWIKPALKLDSSSQKTEAELPPEGYAIRFERVNSQAAWRSGAAGVIAFLAIALTVLVILLSVKTVQPKGQNVITEANFLQKFDSNQIPEATITYNPGGTSTITGEFIETDANG